MRRKQVPPSRADQTTQSQHVVAVHHARHAAGSVFDRGGEFCNPDPGKTKGKAGAACNRGCRGIDESAV